MNVLNIIKDDSSEDHESFQLAVTELECIRQDFILFQDVNFELTSGNLLQVDGVNGSGKSSLLRIIAGLMQPNNGKVTWQGAEISKCRYQYQQKIVYIGHLNGVKDALTAKENLQVMMALADSRLEVQLSSVLDHIGLSGMDDILLSRMSAGQKRRVALARLLVTRSNVWILDEPFTSLDVSGKAIIERLIIEHSDRGGIIIFSTHQPMEIKGCSLRHIHLGNKS